MRSRPTAWQAAAYNMHPVARWRRWRAYRQANKRWPLPLAGPSGLRNPHYFVYAEAIKPSFRKRLFDRWRFRHKKPRTR
jgi:hypothetical protein